MSEREKKSLTQEWLEILGELRPQLDPEVTNAWVAVGLSLGAVIVAAAACLVL